MFCGRHGNKELGGMIMQCLDGLKHLAAILLTCCDADSPAQSKGLQNPKAVARGTVCMSTFPILYCF